MPFILFIFTVLWTQSSFALESLSYNVQPELPNYGSNTQVSDRFSLNGDTTWHMQPSISNSYQMQISMPTIVSSSMSSTTSATEIPDSSGLRPESIDNKSPSSNQQSSINSATPSESLIFSPSITRFPSLFGSVFGSHAAADEQSRSSESTVQNSVSSKVTGTTNPNQGSTCTNTTGTKCQNTISAEVLRKENSAMFRALLSSIYAPRHTHTVYWVNDVLLLLIILIQFVLTAYLCVKVVTLKKSERVLLSALLQADGPQKEATSTPTFTKKSTHA
jgi:hypothetical protein